MSKLEEAKAAANRLFSDTSVSKSKTISELRELREEIDDMLDSLGSDAPEGC